MWKELKDYDGVHKPRPSQEEIISRVKAESHALIQLKLATGFGKSSIAVALIRSYVGQGVILTANNQLVDQYERQYPDICCIKGKDNYNCKGNGYCRECSVIDSCEYQQKVNRVNNGEPFITNMAFYLWYISFNKSALKGEQRLLILDEYDTLNSLIQSCGEVKFKNASFNMHTIKREIEEQGNQMQKKVLAYALRHNEEVFIDVQDDATVLQYVMLPHMLVNLITYRNKVIQMSGTLNPYHAHELKKERYAIIEAEHVIDAEVRQVHYKPIPLNAHINDLVNGIMSLIDVKENTLIHVTYDYQMILLKALKARLGNRLIFNERSNVSKQSCVNRFGKEKGLVWLGAGVAVGIDLAGELCRCQIIPRLIWANKNEYIKKCLALRGNIWYSGEAIRHLVQASGRASRGVNDKSDTYVLDARLPALLTWGEARALVPKWFKVNMIDQPVK